MTRVLRIVIPVGSCLGFLSRGIPHANELSFEHPSQPASQPKGAGRRKIEDGEGRREKGGRMMEKETE